MNRPNYILLLAASIFLIATLASSGASTLLLEEDFESYADDAALDAVWPKVGNATTYLADAPDDSGNAVLYSKGDRRHRAFGPVTPTDEDPLYLRVEFYDDYQVNVPGRDYVGLWGGASIHDGRLIEVGLYNHDPALATDHYNARVFGSVHGFNWFDLQTQRSAGWHVIEIIVFSDTAEIHFDGDLDTVVDWAGGELGAVRLGFGAGASQTGVYYDDLLIESRKDFPLYSTNFAASEGFTPGDLNTQDGWAVEQGTASVTANGPDDHTVILQSGSPRARISRNFTEFSSESVVFLDFSVSGGAGEPPSNAPEASSPDAFYVALVKEENLARFYVFAGDGAGSGEWVPSNATAPVDSNGNLLSWVVVTVRLDYVRATFDLYVDGILAGHDYGLLFDDVTHFSKFALHGNPEMDVVLDDFYASPVPVMWENQSRDGITDWWKELHEFSLTGDIRDDDPYQENLSNIERFLLQTGFEFDPAGATVFHDDFESGDLSNWTEWSTGSALTVSTGENRTPRGSYSAALNNSSQKMYRDLGSGVEGAASFTFWIYDDMGSQTRWFGEARTGFQQIFAIGHYGVSFGSGTGNLAAETVDHDRYQGRVLSGTNAGWFNLDAVGAPHRSPGWHKFEIRRLADGTTIEFYVDGVLSRTITGAVYKPVTQLTIGTGIGSSSGNVWFDEVRAEYSGLPVIEFQSSSGIRRAGGSYGFGVSAKGNVERYKWFLNDEEILGAESTSIGLFGLGSEDAGEYRVVVSNGVGSVTSDPFYLAVVSGEPSHEAVDPGTEVNLTVDVHSPPGLNFEWRRNGVPLIDGARISGVNTSTLTIDAANRGDEGAYTVLLSLDGVQFETKPAALRVNGTLVFHDDFSSGDLDNWTDVPGSTSLTISGSHTRPGSDYAAKISSSTDKMYQNLETDVGGHARAVFWIYDNGESMDVRWFGEVRAYQTDGFSVNGNDDLEQVFAIGKYHSHFSALNASTGSLVGETVNLNKYQGRVGYGENTGWFNLDALGSPNASIGWHKFEIERMADGTTINFYVDGILSRTITGANYAEWDVATIGSVGHFSHNPVDHDAWFGEVTVEYLGLVPEMIGGIQQWFSADFETDGENFVETDGDGSVTKWRERAKDDGLDLEQDVSGSQPGFISGSSHPSGFGTLSFDGSGQFLMGESPLTSDMDELAFVFVWRPSSLQEAILWQHSNSQGAFSIQLASNGSYGLAVNGVMTDQAHVYQAHEHIVSVLAMTRDDATGAVAAQLYHNTRSSLGETVGTVSIVTPSELTIGGDTNGGYFSGKMQEFLVYNADIDSDEIELLTDSFATAYNLSLDRTGDGKPDDPHADSSWGGVPSWWLLAEGWNPWDPMAAWYGFDMSGLSNYERYRLDHTQRGHWSLAFGSGTTVEDQSGFNNDGDFSADGVSWRPDGFGIALDGQGNVTIDESGAGSLDFGEDSLSISAWARNGGTGDGVILSKGGYGNSPGYTLRFHNGRICATLGGHGAALEFETTQLYDDQEWHHVVAVFNRLEGTAFLFVDGERQDVNTVGDGIIIDGNILDFSEISGLLASSPANLLLGAASDPSGDPFANLTGDIADVRLYDLPLTDEMVRALHSTDTRQSGISDAWMLEHFGSLSFPPEYDYWGLGVSLLQAYHLDLDPKAVSTNDDGIPDWWKVQYFSSFVDQLDRWIWLLNSPAADDRYLSGVTLIQAYQLGLDPTVESTDDDGLPDWWKVKHFAVLDEDSNEWMWATSERGPNDDPDNDLLKNLDEFDANTLPLTADTDSDQMLDGWEVVYELDPLDDGSYDFFLGPEGDVSMDGLTNLEKFKLGQNPREQYVHAPPLFSRDSNHSQAFVSGPLPAEFTTIWVSNPNPTSFTQWERDEALGFITYTTDGSEPRSSDARLDADDPRLEVAGVIDPQDPRIEISGPGNHIIKARVFSLGAVPSETVTLIVTLGANTASKDWYYGRKYIGGQYASSSRVYSPSKTWFDGVKLGKGWIIGGTPHETENWITGGEFVPDLRSESRTLYYGKLIFRDQSSYRGYSLEATSFGDLYLGGHFGSYNVEVGKGWIQWDPDEGTWGGYGMIPDMDEPAEDVYYVKHNNIGQSLYVTLGWSGLDHVRVGEGWIAGTDAYIPDMSAGPEEIWVGESEVDPSYPVYSLDATDLDSFTQIENGWLTAFDTYIPDVRNKDASGSRTLDPEDAPSSETIYKRIGSIIYETDERQDNEAVGEGWLTSRSSYLPDDEAFRTDSDGDGLIDGFEEFFGTDPDNPDTSGDYLSDWEKAKHWNALPASEKTPELNPAGHYEMHDDVDGDGLSNYNEMVYQTDPFQKDSDADGLEDREEIIQGSNPRDPEDTEPSNDLALVMVAIGDPSESKSEVWELNFNGGGTNGLVIRSPLGKVEKDIPLRLPRGRSYTVKVNWVSTNNIDAETGELAPDYDYHAEIVVKGAEIYRLVDEKGLLGSHFTEQVGGNFEGEDKEVILDLIEFQVEGDLNVAAKTEWSEQDELDYKTVLTVKIFPENLPVDVRDSILANTSLSFGEPLGGYYLGGYYIPDALGTLSHEDDDPAVWTYVGFGEPKALKHARQVVIPLEIVYNGATQRSPSKSLKVFPYYIFLANGHKAQAAGLGDDPTQEHLEMVYEFLRWRYGASFDQIPSEDFYYLNWGSIYGAEVPYIKVPYEVGFRDVDISAAISGDIDTFVEYIFGPEEANAVLQPWNSIRFYRNAFQGRTESQAAGTIAHELYHTGQSGERRLIKKRECECTAYRYIARTAHLWGGNLDQRYMEWVHQKIAENCSKE